MSTTSQAAAPRPAEPTLGGRCAATGRGCGSTTGWRRGGRCPACRDAHAQDSNRRRGIGPLSPADRQAALDAFSQGHDERQVAAMIGRSVRSLAKWVRVDAELRLAAAGAPAAVQQIARMGDYLAALTRHHGRPQAAADELGAGEQLAIWRANPKFRAAENSTRALASPAPATATAVVSSPRPGTQDRHTPAADARLTRLWADDSLTTAQIARDLDVGLTTVKLWAARLGLGRRVGKRARQSPAADARLAELWADTSWTTWDIARDLDISPTTTYLWAARLRLGPRPDDAARRPPGPDARRHPAVDARLIELWADRRRPLQVIADELGVAVSTVSQRAARLGLRPRQGARTRRTPATDARLARLWADASWATADIARDLGASLGTVHTWAARLNLGPRPDPATGPGPKIRQAATIGRIIPECRYTYAQLAAALDAGTKTLRTWRAKGLIPSPDAPGRRGTPAWWVGKTLIAFAENSPLPGL